MKKVPPAAGNPSTRPQTRSQSKTTAPIQTDAENINLISLEEDSGFETVDDLLGLGLDEISTDEEIGEECETGE